MTAVILADRYSSQTINQIIEYYKKFQFDRIIICQSSETELIEEVDQDKVTLIFARVGKANNYLTQLKKIKSLIFENAFFLTFGDYFSSVDLNNLLKFHKSNAKVASIAAIKRENCYYNAGFIVIDTDLFDYITEKTVELEDDLFMRIGEDDELAFYIFKGNSENIFSKRKMFQIN